MRSKVIDKQRATHPSFGVIEMTRIGGYTPRLVGSVSAAHNTAIRLTIHRGERGATFSGDNDSWSSTGHPIVEINMSLIHWAELITLTGMGVHTPCTLVAIGGERMPDPPENDSRIERVLEESRADLFDGPDPSDEAREELRALRLDIEALKVPKAAKAELIRRVEAAQSKLREPGVVAHVAAERLGRHLEAAAVEARIEARASNGLLSPTMAIDASIGLALSASKAEGDE